MEIEGADSLKPDQLIVGVIGLGYVGLPLALSFCNNDVKVYGIDVHAGRLEKLRSAKSYVSTVSDQEINSMLKVGFEPTADFSVIKNVDVIIICVPTPLTEQAAPDLSFILDTLKAMKGFLSKGQTIILESTTFPGTTRDVVMPILQEDGWQIGKEIFLVYSPERENPGDYLIDRDKIPKIVSGITKKCLKRGRSIYQRIVDEVVEVSSPECAEFTKLLENSHRAVNIGLVNELKLLATKLDLDIFEIVSAAATKPFGFSAFYPGPGVGGHCIPVDPMFLAWKAKTLDMKTQFIELASEVNKYMEKHVLDIVTSALNDLQKSVNGSNILILGISYKKNVNDARESPSIALMKALSNLGAKVSYSDPLFSHFPAMRDSYFDLQSVSLDSKTIKSFDCVVLVTDHDNFDYGLIEEHAKMIIDTRGRFNAVLEKVSLA